MRVEFPIAAGGPEGPEGRERQSACGNASLRTWRSEGEHQRQFALGVVPHGQCRQGSACGHTKPEDVEIQGRVSASVRRGGGAPRPV